MSKLLTILFTLSAISTVVESSHADSAYDCRTTAPSPSPEPGCRTKTPSPKRAATPPSK